MSLITLTKKLLFWRKEQKLPRVDLSTLDYYNSKLQETVLETNCLSQRIIHKLEDKLSIVEHKLSDREELLNIIFASIPDILILKDGQGRWQLINPYAKKIFGLEGNDYKNKTDNEISVLSPKFKDMQDICSKTDEQAWADRAPVQIEERSIDIYGTESIFDMTKIPIFNEDGTNKHLLVHGKNITEELANTKHIRMLLNALNKASDSITVTDHLHNIIYANNKFCQVFGYTLEEVLDKPRKLIASGNTPSSTYDEMFESINNGISWTGKMINKTKSGTEIEEVVTITPILNGKPHPIYYIGVNRLVERRKEKRYTELHL
jgi:PAS domain S-box-containing protein